MVLSKEILSDFKEQFEKAQKLVNEESKNDPPTDPYRSHYAARDVLQFMKNELKNSIASVLAEEEDGGADDVTYKVILGFVLRDLGRIYIFTEETAIGEQILNDCIELLEPYKLEAEVIIPYIGALNELGIVNANRLEYQKAYEILIKVEKFYKDFKRTNATALCLTDVLGTRDEIEIGKGVKEFESLYTMCSFYLAQVFGHLGELEKSAEYCNMTLRRQITAESYESIDFALNAATLSQYYIGQNMFVEARHHLAAATYIMDEYELKMFKPEMTEKERADVKETFDHRYADVGRCWSKYGLSLLLASKERLYRDDDAADDLTNDVKRLKIQNNDYKFTELKLQIYEDRVTADYCLTFDDAKLVYHFLINWLDIAKDYYKPETEATEYAKIMQDYAELYQNIAFFEEDPNNEIKMHKRRSKYYEDLLELLNSVFYMGICRQCWYGAGLAQCSILDIRLEALNDNNKPAPQELHKINTTCRKAIDFFQQFIKSYMEKDGVTIKANLEGEEERSVLYTYFYLGRLFYKIITPDFNLQLENLNSSLIYYKKFTDECDKREIAAKSLQSEIGVCREMVKLLPMKIETVKKRLKT